VSVTVSPTTAALTVGKTIALTATLRGDSNRTLPGRAVVWSSSDASVAMVTDGEVTGVAPGLAVITASSEGKRGTATVTVSLGDSLAAVSTVAVHPDTATVAVGATTTLSVELRDSVGSLLTGQPVAWTSNDETKATVDAGVVTGVSIGTAVIVATSAGKQGTAVIHVTAGTAGSGAMTVSFATLLGGGKFEHARDVATDAAGYIYVAGGTMSPDFPTTPGAFQRVHNPGTPDNPNINPMDVFVVKLSPTGQLIWSTLLGGPNYDRAYAVEVDAQGNVYVAGRAGAGFPVTAGAFQTAFQGGEEASFYGPQDGFVCKLNPSGSARIYCSYFGTTDPRIVRDLAIDAQGNAYLASSAGSDGLPASWFANAYQKTRSGGVDGVIAKINPAGSQVVWATYLGGTQNEGNGENSIRVDAVGNVYFVENARSPGLPTPNGFDHTLAGPRDLYLAKFAPDGQSLLYATYIGGSETEFTETHALALDSIGNAYVTVTTASADFPTTPGAFQRSYGGTGGANLGQGTNYPYDAAVVKVSPTGSLLAATYIGGRYGEGAEGIGVDQQGNVSIAGGTFSDNFPRTTQPFQNRGGQADIFVSSLSPDFGTLRFSQVFGGNGDDMARSSMVDGQGNVYAVGEAASGNFPTMNAYQSGSNGNTDAVVIKLVPGG